MKFVFASPNGDAMFLARQVYLEGNDVVLWIESKDAKAQGDGMVPKVDRLEQGLGPPSKDTIVIFDMVGKGALADRLRKRGFSVLGGGLFQDRIELDRTFGVDLMRKSGMATPKTATFNSWNEAKAHVKKNSNALVFKPHGNMPTSLTHVAESSEEMLAMLDYFSSIFKGRPEFLIQERIHGIEISHEVWFNGTSFVRPFNSTLERKKFLDGDLGPNTGCQHSLVWLWEDEEPKIFTMTIKNLESVLKRHNYVGPLDINTIISWDDWRPYGLEWTARFGYSALQALMELLEMEVAQFLADIAKGQMKEAVYQTDMFASALRVSIPPYPHGTPKETAVPLSGIPVLNFNERHHSPGDMRAGDEGDFNVAGHSGVVVESLGVGRAPKQAMDQSKIWAQNLQLPNKQFRTDVGELEERHLEDLRDWRFI